MSLSEQLELISSSNESNNTIGSNQIRMRYPRYAALVSAIDDTPEIKTSQKKRIRYNRSPENIEMRDIQNSLMQFKRSKPSKLYVPPKTKVQRTGQYFSTFHNHHYSPNERNTIAQLNSNNMNKLHENLVRLNLPTDMVDQLLAKSLAIKSMRSHPLDVNLFKSLPLRSQLKKSDHFFFEIDRLHQLNLDQLYHLNGTSSDIEYQQNVKSDRVVSWMTDFGGDRIEWKVAEEEGGEGGEEGGGEGSLANMRGAILHEPFREVPNVVIDVIRDKLGLLDNPIQPYPTHPEILKQFSKTEMLRRVSRDILLDGEVDHHPSKHRDSKESTSNLTNDPSCNQTTSISNPSPNTVDSSGNPPSETDEGAGCNGSPSDTPPSIEELHAIGSAVQLSETVRDQLKLREFENALGRHYESVADSLLEMLLQFLDTQSGIQQDEMIHWEHILFAIQQKGNELIELDQNSVKVSDTLPRLGLSAEVIARVQSRLLGVYGGAVYKNGFHGQRLSGSDDPTHPIHPTRREK